MEEKLKEQLEWSDTDKLRSIFAFLDTQNWCIVGEDIDDLTEIRAAVEVIITHFRIALEAKSFSVCSIQDEGEEAVQYSWHFLCVPQDIHKKVWYQLHTVPDSTKRPNVLLLFKCSP